MDAGERALLETTVRDAIAGATSEPPAAVDAVLDEIGWREMLGAEPGAAVEIVFTALGTANRAASVLDDVVVSALGVEPRADLAVLLPRFAAWDPPGRIDGEHLSARGSRACGRPPRPSCSSWLTRETIWLGQPFRWQPSTCAPCAGSIPTPSSRPCGSRSDGALGAPLDEGAWESAVALGRRALAHEIAGASRTMLELAITHAMERVQFGRPIGRFQAVRHRLADALVAVEALEAAAAAAADEPTPSTAALAKAIAGRSARTVAAHCQQVLAGIGFTTDHPFHRFMKRTMLLEGVFGSADEIVVDLGRGLLATRTVPTVIEL